MACLPLDQLHDTYMTPQPRIYATRADERSLVWRCARRSDGESAVGRRSYDKRIVWLGRRRSATRKKTAARRRQPSSLSGSVGSAVTALRARLDLLPHAFPERLHPCHAG